MIRWGKKKTAEIVQPQKGDKKIFREFLWWPTLLDDGCYYWLGFVDVEYICGVGIIWYGCFFGYLPGKCWKKTKIIPPSKEKLK